MSLSPPIRESRERRFGLLSRAAIAGFGLVVLGLLRLQVVQHDKYLQLANENRVRLEVLRAPRGVIYAAGGDLLADSAPSFGIVFRPFPAESAQRARGPDPGVDAAGRGPGRGRHRRDPAGGGDGEPERPD